MLTNRSSKQTPVRIVVAAAEPAFRDRLREQLEQEVRVHVVGEAPDSLVAGMLVYSLTPDVLIIECEMNRELARRRVGEADLSAPAPNVVVLVTPGEPQHILEAFELGAKGVVLKTSLPEEWGPGIERVIAGQYWIADESIAVLLQAARQSTAHSRKSQPEPSQLMHFGLTRRETEIARKIAAGRSNRELGQEFSIRERTVKHHLTNIFRKVGVSSRLELAVLVRDGATNRTLINKTHSPALGKVNAG